MPDEAAQLEAQAAQQNQAALNDIGGQAPEASEPLQGNRIANLHASMTRALEALSGGQGPFPPEPAVQDAAEQVPPELFAFMLVMAEVADQLPEAEAYRFDPVASAMTNQGLMDAAGMIEEMGKDAAVVQAAQEFAPEEGDEQATPEEGADEDTGEDEDLRAMVR